MLTEEMRLSALARKQSDDYVEERKKKIPKKKPPKEKKNIAVDFNSNPTATEGAWKSVWSKGKIEEKKFNIVEQKIIKNRARVKVQCSERMQKYQEEVNYKRQKQAEKAYIEEQENLMETWFRSIERDKEIRSPNSLGFLPNKRHTFRRGRFVISLLSKKYWNDSDDPPVNKQINSGRRSKKKEKPKEKKKKLERKGNSKNDLSEEFSSKLMFVDVECCE